MGSHRVGHDWSDLAASYLKKNKILPFAATWMDLGGIMLSEISQTEKYKVLLIYGI